MTTTDPALLVDDDASGRQIVPTRSVNGVVRRPRSAPSDCGGGFWIDEQHRPTALVQEATR